MNQGAPTRKLLVCPFLKEPAKDGITREKILQELIEFFEKVKTLHYSRGSIEIRSFNPEIQEHEYCWGGNGIEIEIDRSIDPAEVSIAMQRDAIFDPRGHIHYTGGVAQKMSRNGREFNLIP